MTEAAASLDDPEYMRHAGRDLLSLALMAARNRSLHWLAALEGEDLGDVGDEFDPPAWAAGQVAWFQEAWIARNPQRARGAHCDRPPPRLASIWPQADEWFDPRASTRAQRWLQALPGDTLRAFLADTLETTLELLDAATPDDDALYFFRLALLHEERSAQTLAALMQASDLPPEKHTGLWPLVANQAQRDPLSFGAQVWAFGSTPGGLVPDNEPWQQPEKLPEFDLDAQAVSWAQYAEFVADGGYDEPRWWHPAGWAWLQATGRRAPRYVEQLGGQGAGVLLRQRGRLQRAAAAQPAVHISWYEADAWCRWAGRRLPTEVEWELAACTATARGLRWGRVFEWTAGAARPEPSLRHGPAGLDEVPASVDGVPARVLRGASDLTPHGLRHPRARRFAQPQRDELFSGFRSCSL
ncbi:hypothetical protein BurJ1DRAFT_4827 [Burkholderiales bacterium JOSHI_001]|nr:hypothetical protein BurJ1DRAFT_4827 [Burkholderiales bacterium JOSHI_001]